MVRSIVAKPTKLVNMISLIGQVDDAVHKPKCVLDIKAEATGGPSPRFGYATPPAPLPALRAHLVTKGQ